MTILYSDPVFLEHETGQHPENPDRLRSIVARLTKTGLMEQCEPGTYRSLTEGDVVSVHDPEVIERIRRLAGVGGGYLDGDTPMVPESGRVALAAAGACVSAVDAVMAGQATNALCLVRPPGHHATPTRSMGFCLYNNVALAARHARKQHGLSRILIVDWDVHHGNGTQDVFYDEDGVFFFSIHRYGHGFYPGTGAADETGTGRGLGYNKNVTVRYGTSRPDFRAMFTQELEKAADFIRPELVLVSAGFDAHARDPIGCLGLETEDFGDLTGTVMSVARTHAAGRLVSCLEGGYNLHALAESVQAHLEELLTS